VAGSLIGTRKTHALLSERLRGSGARQEPIVFSEDASVAAQVPDRYAEMRKMRWGRGVPRVL
jgi:hypothetical protein